MTSELLTLGIVQCALGGSREENVARVEGLVREAAGRGRAARRHARAPRGPLLLPRGEGRLLRVGAPRRGERRRSSASGPSRRSSASSSPSRSSRGPGNAYYNTLAMIDADGALLGTYRKSHIPDGPGYEEKFYFRPGDTGFRVFATKAGAVGGAVCWDQWFPECARALALGGADVLLYPTAIGSEPANPVARHARPVAARDGRTRRVQRHPRRRREPDRRGGRAALLRLLVRRRDPTARSSPRWDATRRGSASSRSTSRRSGASARPGASSATGGPELYGALMTADGNV